jgi:hypothetical protein
VAGTGINFADFLLGRLESVSAIILPTLGKRISYYGGYVQDDWRASSRLTINLGLRYETETPPYGVNDLFQNFDPWAPNPLAGTGDIPVGARGVTTFQNRNGNGKYLWNWSTLNLGPRFGFAYRLSASGDMVVRGGFGLYYGVPITAALVEAGNSPFGEVYSASYPVSYALQNALPANSLLPPDPSQFTPTWGDRGTKFAQASMTFVDANFAANYSENFNLTLQKQWKGISFEGSYIGNLGRHVPSVGENINKIPPNLLSQTSINQRLRRPVSVLNSDTAVVTETDANWGISDYHAFTFKIERRMSKGLGWLVSFTHMKWIDNAPFPGGGNPQIPNDDVQNIYNLRGEKSLSTGDVPNRLVMSPIFELPVGKGRRWLNRGGFVNAVLGGWELSTITTLQNGTPFGVSVLNGGLNYLGDSTGLLRPNMSANPKLSSGQGEPASGVLGVQWFNAAAFTVPAKYTYGNAARTIPGMFTPGLINFDTLLAKNFMVAERWRAQFRWETFDTWNTPRFNPPNSVLGANNFGLVTAAAANSRRIMQVALKISF